MNLYVCLKQVPDTETKIKLTTDQQSVDLSEIKWILSPYDEFALEEAVRLKEKNSGSTLTVVAAGPARTVEVLRTGLALGADQAIHIQMTEGGDASLLSKAITAVLKKEPSPDFIFCGKESIDEGGAQVGIRIAMQLGIECCSVVQKIEYLPEGKVKIFREVEGGALEVLEASRPLLLTTQKGLNEPRYASIPNLMKAKKKEIRTISLADLGISEKDTRMRYKNFQLPPKKQAGKKISGEPAVQARELVRLLREEAKVI